MLGHRYLSAGTKKYSLQELITEALAYERSVIAMEYSSRTCSKGQCSNAIPC